MKLRTNKPSGLPLTVQPDIALKCSAGTVGGTNTATLTVTANTLSFSTNASITGTLGVTDLPSLVNVFLSGALTVNGNSTFYGTLTTVNGGLNKCTVDSS